MTAERTVRVDPHVMKGFADALSGGAEDLRHRLIELDGRVREMLGTWHGASGNAYTTAWEQWHRGAGEIPLGLSILANALGQAGAGYRENETAAVRTLRDVGNG